MGQKTDVKFLEGILNKISKYQTPVNDSIKAFLEDTGISFTRRRKRKRPEIKGISTSSLMREIRAGRCGRYT